MCKALADVSKLVRVGARNREKGRGRKTYIFDPEYQKKRHDGRGRGVVVGDGGRESWKDFHIKCKFLSLLNLNEIRYKWDSQNELPASLTEAQYTSY